MLEKVFLGNTIQSWFTAIGTAILVLLVLKILQKVGTRRLSALAKRTTTDLDDLVVEMLSKTKFVFLLLIALYAGAQVLTLSQKTQQAFDKVAILVILLQATFWANGAVAYWLKRTIAQRKEVDAASATTLSGLGFVAKLVLWSVVVLLGLDNMGINITGLVAGLGVGGIAIALAIQNILGDLFASLSIVLDKPFVIGDSISVDDHMGSVEHIGLKTTRIRSLSGEQIVFSNADLLKSRIRNFKRMFERRVLFTLGMRYETPYEKLRLINTMLRRIIESQQQTRFDRAHFKEYGDSALIYEVVYYVTSADYSLYMDIQQAINLEIYRQFQETGIEFAHPTRTVYMHQESQVLPPSESGQAPLGAPTAKSEY